jgi:hypothetical protein
MDLRALDGAREVRLDSIGQKSYFSCLVNTSMGTLMTRGGRSKVVIGTPRIQRPMPRESLRAK